jgi:hypothetical protein
MIRISYRADSGCIGFYAAGFFRVFRSALRPYLQRMAPVLLPRLFTGGVGSIAV